MERITGTIPVRDLIPPDPDPTPTPKTEYLTFATKTANQISVKEVSTGEYEMSMTGTDPYIFTNSLERTNPADSCILTFQYRCDKEISFLQLFFASTPSSGVSEDRSVKVDGIPASQTWKTWKANVSESLVNSHGGKPVTVCGSISETNRGLNSI